MRAVELVRRRSGVRRGAKLRLVKRIPAAAGLGGGSSDAAAALVAANEGWRLGRSREELAQWAAELGSDVPFFLAGGPAICRGRGEQVTPVAGLGRACTSWSSGRRPGCRRRPCMACAGRPQSAQTGWPLVEALRQGDWKQAARRLCNRLQPAAETLSPLGETIATGVFATGFSGIRDEWKWHVVLWTLPSRSPGAAQRATFGGIAVWAACLPCEVAVDPPESQGEQPWKSPRSV